MRMSRAGYYADFAVYPPVALTMATIELYSRHSYFFIRWLIACLIGIVGWTLAEYVMHRFVLHSVPSVARLHDMHHANPSGFVGTPTWLSLAGFGLGVIPFWWLAGFEAADGFAIGLIIGYLWYLVVHDAVHRWRLDRDSLLYRAKLRHAHHHRGNPEGNFGVTTQLWDRLFGTAIDHSRVNRTLRSKVAFLLALTGGAVATMVVFTAPPTYAQGTAAGPFDALAGTWSGNGVVNLSDGSRERVRCIAKYVSQNSGYNVRLELRCASDSYKVEFSSSIVQSGGSLSGNWFESTRRVGGKISGRANGGQIDVRADGDTFMALLAVKTQGSRQSFSMESPGARLSEFSIALNRAPR
jgi:hypothetical protein